MATKRMRRAGLLSLVGQRFGRLIAVSEDLEPPDPKKRRWVCQCDCGRRAVIAQSQLRSGKTSSCGCLKWGWKADDRYGNLRKGNHPSEYATWGKMKRRCLVPDDPAFHNYGGRGITICERWVNDFAAFYTDMGPKPTPEHTLERIRNDGNYEPRNCRWATPAEQSRNTRQNRTLTLNGEARILTDWANIIGIRKGTLHVRVKRLGWSDERALTTPLRVTHRRK